MKFPRVFSIISASVAVGLLAAFAPRAGSANTAPAPAKNSDASNSKTNASTSTNGVLADLPVQTAVFDLTLKTTKDPFFPLTTRQPIPVVVVTNIPSAYSLESFSLKSLDGSRKERLAIINNRTFAVGETNELNTPGGKIKIKCVEIKEKSVVILEPGKTETLEIFLRKTAQ